MKDSVVTVRRPTGLEVTLRVPGDWTELMRRANDEFGSPRSIGGPEMPDMEKYKRKRR